MTEMTPGGDNGLVDSIEAYYLCLQNKVSFSVSGYDTSLDALDLVSCLEKHFQSCGFVETIQVPRHPVTNAITDRFVFSFLYSSFIKFKNMLTICLFFFHD